jgi:hypothetical protein
LTELSDQKLYFLWFRNKLESSGIKVFLPNSAPRPDMIIFFGGKFFAVEVQRDMKDEYVEKRKEEYVGSPYDVLVCVGFPDLNYHIINLTDKTINPEDTELFEVGFNNQFNVLPESEVKDFDKFLKNWSEMKQPMDWSFVAKKNRSEPKRKLKQAWEILDISKEEWLEKLRDPH